MSEEHFHVHGAHDHAVEHAAHEGPGLGQQVAIFTALMSAIGAVVSYQGGNTANEAMLYKNEAVLQKSLASDQWNYYEAKSTKVHLMELAADVGPASRQAAYRQQIEKNNKQKAEIKAKAEEFEQKSTAANEESQQALRPHHNLARAMTFIQIAISLASITVLTRARWLFILAGISSVSGVALWAWAWFGPA
jgi:hypothetical protein